MPRIDKCCLTSHPTYYLQISQAIEIPPTKDKYEDDSHSPLCSEELEEIQFVHIIFALL